ncbi:hypothetical protein Y1Q_0001367 [Alligator mississippiensis]|uniref:Uncharacterized protein n=1 Tax=Alligator mississippiensis TaxID=8496 RepID=A0A151M9D9_ALLMI|nr:hypothetical protein Y1Q_0001367 [Alligator mississippiensis]
MLIHHTKQLRTLMEFGQGSRMKQRGPESLGHIEDTAFRMGTLRKKLILGFRSHLCIELGNEEERYLH